MLNLGKNRIPKGALVLNYRFNMAAMPEGTTVSEIIEKKIVPLQKKYPYAHIYIEVR
ncbi:MAG: hypothetical protein K2O91_12015 [Lachnospiraceae bacterium]|nr:hypothetical protein [Lachnospiraceae bacterium]